MRQTPLARASCHPYFGFLSLPHRRLGAEFHSMCLDYPQPELVRLRPPGPHRPEAVAEQLRIPLSGLLGRVVYEPCNPGDREMYGRALATDLIEQLDLRMAPDLPRLRRVGPRRDPEAPALEGG